MSKTLAMSRGFRVFPLRRTTDDKPGVVTAWVLSVLLLLIWQGAAMFMPPYLLPSPVEVFPLIVELFSTGSFYYNSAMSLWHVAASITVAFAVSLVIAVLAHFQPVIRKAVYERLNLFLSSFSTIGWTFLAIMWFGLNEFTVIFAVAVTLTPFALSNLRTSLEELDPEAVEMAASFGRSRLRNLQLVILPLMVPYIFATLRICLGVAWKVVLTAELFGGASGLGYLVSRARANFEIPTLFAIFVVIVCFVYLTDKYVLDVIHRRLRKNYAALG